MIKQSENEIKKIVPLTIASIRIKKLEISLTKYMSDLYNANDNMPLKEINDLNKWKDTLFMSEKTSYC